MGEGVHHFELRDGPYGLRGCLGENEVRTNVSKCCEFVCVVQSCGVVVRMAMVVDGLNQCSVMRFCRRVSTVVFEWKERVTS